MTFFLNAVGHADGKSLFPDSLAPHGMVQLPGLKPGCAATQSCSDQTPPFNAVLDTAGSLYPAAADILNSLSIPAQEAVSCNPSAVARLLAVFCGNPPDSAAGTDSVASQESLHPHSGLPGGLSELDDIPTAALAAKPAYLAVAGHEAAPKTALERVHDFRIHELSDTAGDFAANVGLDVFLGAAGGAALKSGVSDILHARACGKSLAEKRRELSERRQMYADYLRGTSATPQDEAGQIKRVNLQKQCIVLDHEMIRLDRDIRMHGKQMRVGGGSAAAGSLSVLRSVLDLIMKPLAYAHASLAPVAGTVASGAAIGVPPAAAVAALYMGIKAKKLNGSQRDIFRKKLQLALAELDMKQEKMPPEMKAHYQRCFVDGKWADRDRQTKSFNTLLGWFVGGMSGYGAATTGLSIAKIIALVVAGATIADVTLSTAILASAAVVALGMYGFFKYHSKEHQYAEWSNAKDPGFDRDFFMFLAASGDFDGLLQPVRHSAMIEHKRERRQTFLHELAQSAGLHFYPLRAHSVDDSALKEKRQAQKQEMKKQQGTLRYLAGKKGFLPTALNEKKLEALLLEKNNAGQVMDYMLSDLDEEIATLSCQLAVKTRVYSGADTGADMPDVPGLPANQQTDKNSNKARRFADRLFRRTDKKDRAVAAAPDLPTLKHQVDSHFLAVGRQLAMDQCLHDQMTALHRALTAARSSLASDATEECDMQAFLDRFHAVQRRQLHSAGSPDEQPRRGRLANYLLHQAPARERKTLGCLQVFTLDTVEMRTQAAALPLLLPNLQLAVPSWDHYVASLA